MDGPSNRRSVSSGSPFESRVGYCRAVAIGEQVWSSGTAPQWPDGTVVEDAGAQARRCFEIIEEALGQLGGGLADIVRVRVFLVDASDFDAVAAVHGELFADVRPTNTTLVVAGLLDPRWKVEIEVDAVLAQRR
jgi:enamine deaminase RidA (YjgF/YER057c/UK114 family)